MMVDKKCKQENYLCSNQKRKTEHQKRKTDDCSCCVRMYGLHGSNHVNREPGLFILVVLGTQIFSCRGPRKKIIGCPREKVKIEYKCTVFYHQVMQDCDCSEAAF